MHNSQGCRDSKQKGSMTQFPFGEVLPWEASSPAPLQLLPNTKLMRCSEVGNPRLGPHCRRGIFVLRWPEPCATPRPAPGWGSRWSPGSPVGKALLGGVEGAEEDSWLCGSALISRPLHKRWLPLNTTRIFKEQTSHLYLNDEYVAIHFRPEI